MQSHPTTSPSRSRFPWTQRPIPFVVAAGLALLVAGTHLTHRLHFARSFRLEFSVLSRTPFHEEIPRVGQLDVIHPDGRTETLEYRRYASGFLDLRSTFRFEIADDRANRVVFFPSPGNELVAITGVSLTRAGNGRQESIPLEKLVPLAGAELMERDSNHVVVRTTRGERPAGLGLALDELAISSVPSPIVRIILDALALFGACFALVFAVIRAFDSKMEGRSSRQSLTLVVAVAFVIAAALILTMALCSKFNSHPDEYLHFEAAKYFINHWLPPTLNDPEIAPAYSHYGLSYMRDLDASYFLMGKFIAAFSVWIGSQEIAARLFNVLLFILLGGWMVRRLGTSLAPSILLISPQIWYVYSCVNGDAWALAAAMLVVVQLADEKSGLRKYLQAEGWSEAPRGGLGFALLLTLLIMAKRNYYLFLPFIALVVIWITLGARGPGTMARYAKKWALVGVLTVALYFPLRIGHEAINGFEISRLQLEQAEKYAAPHFKPSDIDSGKGAGRLALRKQGVPFSELLTERGWPSESFQSFCGVYKWMSVKGSDYYYLLMGLLYASLVALLLARIVTISWKDALFASATLGLVLSVILVSAYHSWTVDYQPQGRYLFPILPMFAFLFHHYRERLRAPAFYLLFGCLFVCSIYSFVFTGLRNLLK
jgi:hypothetical protein